MSMVPPRLWESTVTVLLDRQVRLPSMVDRVKVSPGAFEAPKSGACLYVCLQGHGRVCLLLGFWAPGLEPHHGADSRGTIRKVDGPALGAWSVSPSGPGWAQLLTPAERG